MNSQIDKIVYSNIKNYLEQRGITEHQCIIACSLNSSYFSNLRKGITKHFRMCDVVKIARFLEVPLEDICKYNYDSDELFMPRYKLLSRDEKVLTHAFKKLDPIGRINAAEFINEEFKRTKERAKQHIK